MEFRELDQADLNRGFVSTGSGVCNCIFCGEEFEDDLIYRSRGRMVNGKRAVREHLTDVHGGVFNSLLKLDKQVSGLTEVQKAVLEGMYLEKSNKEMAEEMGISIATVRTHKFNIQKLKREAKILLSLLEQIENEELVEERMRIESGSPNVIASDSQVPALDGKKEFTGNNLHPFFSTFNLK